MEGIVWTFNAIFPSQLHNMFKTLGVWIYWCPQGRHGNRSNISSCYLPTNTDTCYPVAIYKGHPSRPVVLIIYVDFWIFSLFAPFSISNDSVICLSHVPSVKLMVKNVFYQIDKNCCLALICFILVWFGLVLSTFWCLKLLGSLVQLVVSQPAHHLFLVEAESENVSLSAAAVMMQL